MCLRHPGFQKPSNVMILIDTCSKNYKRQQFHINGWLQEYKYFERVYEAAFVSNTPVPNFSTVIVPQSVLYHADHYIPTHWTFDKRRSTYVELMARLKVGLEYFLASDADYLLRINDDCGIILRNIVPALDCLDQKYNPWTDNVARGLLVEFEEYGKFLGGGAGCLYSRHIAHHMLDGYYEWIARMQVPDDNYITQRILQYVPIDQISMTGFVSEFPNSQMELLNNEEVSNLPPCPVDLDSLWFYSNIKHAFIFHRNWIWKLDSQSIPTILSSNLTRHIFYTKLMVCIADEQIIQAHHRLFPVFRC